MAEKSGCAKYDLGKIMAIYRAYMGMPFGSDGQITVAPQSKCKKCEYMCLLDVVVENGRITDLKPYEEGVYALEKGQE